MKKHILTFMLVLPVFCFAQEGVQFDYENFEKQFIEYKPVLKAGLSKKTFDYGCMIVEETKKSTKNDPKNFNLADYFNVLSAFLSLQESKANIELAFEKFRDADGSCEYFIGLEKDINKNTKYDIIRDEYRKELAKCKNETPSEKEFDLEAYCKANGLDVTLVREIDKVNTEDQKYRKANAKTDVEKRNEADRKNQVIIDSLYKVYGTYLGHSLVGEKYESVMWAVIQHSNTEMMESYLDVLHQAVKENELDVTPFKMLIDRFYGLKFGYQIYGSQTGFGFEMATEAQRKEIERKYNIH